MRAPPRPDDEEARLEDLASYHILDTPPEEAFDRIADMAVRIFEVPIATVTLVDRHRQWFKACRGLDIRETPRREAFCAYTILNDEVMVVPDARRDERFEGNPLVTDAPGIRFYAGAPLVTPDQHHVGDVCIIDLEPRFHFLDESKETLADLADIVVDELEMRRIDRKRRRLDDRLRAIFELCSDAILVETEAGRIECINDTFASMFGYDADGLRGTPVDRLHADSSHRSCETPVCGESEQIEQMRFQRRDGSTFRAFTRRCAVRSRDGERIGYVTIWPRMPDELEVRHASD